MSYRILLFLSISLIAFGCQKQDFKIEQTYQEPKDPSPSLDENWAAVPKGLQAAITSTNIRFIKSEIPTIKTQNTWTGNVWKGERTSAQF